MSAATSNQPSRAHQYITLSSSIAPFFYSELYGGTPFTNYASRLSDSRTFLNNYESPCCAHVVAISAEGPDSEYKSSINDQKACKST
uniref:Uncharacterized protein n=1 Tax=Cucumis sativus TaxID=3659 RepID=A0A0A0L0P3_CUCSA